MLGQTACQENIVKRGCAYCVKYDQLECWGSMYITLTSPVSWLLAKPLAPQTYLRACQWALRRGQLLLRPAHYLSCLLAGWHYCRQKTTAVHLPRCFAAGGAPGMPCFQGLLPISWIITSHTSQQLCTILHRPSMLNCSTAHAPNYHGT